jgi:hypothetical protein
MRNNFLFKKYKNIYYLFFNKLVCFLKEYSSLNFDEFWNRKSYKRKKIIC